MHRAGKQSGAVLFWGNMFGCKLQESGLKAPLECLEGIGIGSENEFLMEGGEFYFWIYGRNYKVKYYAGEVCLSERGVEKIAGSLRTVR